MKTRILVYVVDRASASESFRKVIERDYVVLVVKEEQDGMYKWRPVKLGAIADVS